MHVYMRAETLSVSSSEGDEMGQKMVDIAMHCKGPDIAYSFPAAEVHDGREYPRYMHVGGYINCFINSVTVSYSPCSSSSSLLIAVLNFVLGSLSLDSSNIFTGGGDILFNSAAFHWQLSLSNGHCHLLHK